MTPSIVALTVLLVTGPYSVDVGQARIVIDKSKAHFAEAGVKLKVNRIIKVRDSYPRLNKLDKGDQKLWLYREVVWKRGYNRRNRTYVILPPMIDSSGIRWIGGFAENSRCLLRGVAVGNAQAVSNSGQERLTSSGICMSHETAHLTGATHIDGINIMDPAALQFWDRPVGFLQSTIYRMRRCLK